MLSLNIQGTLGKYKYEQIPEELALELLNLAGDKALATAKAKAPIKSGNLRNSIYKTFDQLNKIIFIKVSKRDVPYVFAVHFGDKRHFAHPFMKYASDAAKRIINSTVRKATKEAIAKAKG